MKKQYNNPKIKIVGVRPIVMQTTSTLNLKEVAGKSGVVLSREDSGRIWEDEDDEEEDW